MQLTPWVAAICRDKAEGGDGKRYLPEHSHGLLEWWEATGAAHKMGLLDVHYELTPAGRRVGEACKKLPGGKLTTQLGERYVEFGLSAL